MPARSTTWRLPPSSLLTQSSTDPKEAVRVGGAQAGGTALSAVIDVFDGMSPTAEGRRNKVSRQTVPTWLRRYGDGGTAALADELEARKLSAPDVPGARGPRGGAAPSAPEVGPRSIRTQLAKEGFSLPPGPSPIPERRDDNHTERTSSPRSPRAGTPARPQRWPRPCAPETARMTLSRMSFLVASPSRSWLTRYERQCDREAQFFRPSDSSHRRGGSRPPPTTANLRGAGRVRASCQT
jgi:hypothetical protein